MAASAHSAPYTFVPVFEINVKSKTKVVLTKLEDRNVLRKPANFPTPETDRK